MGSALSEGPPPTFALQFEAQLTVERAEYGARIHVTGEAVSVYDEDDEIVAVHGVKPGGVVGFGATVRDACRDHTHRLGLVLDDLLQESASYDEFEHRAQELFAYESPWSRRQFDKAREERELPVV